MLDREGRVRLVARRGARARRRRAAAPASCAASWSTSPSASGPRRRSGYLHLPRPAHRPAQPRAAAGAARAGAAPAARARAGRWRCCCIEPRPLPRDHQHARPRQRRPGHPGAGARGWATCWARPERVARLRGDEFALLLPGRATPRLAQHVAAKILKALEQPVMVEKLPIEVGASIGIARRARPRRRRRGAAAARRPGPAGGRAAAAAAACVYSPECDPYDPQRLVLLGELRRALEADQLLLHYQPKVDLKTRAVIGRRGAGALAPPQARHGAARPVHPAGRAGRADQAAHALGAGRGGRASAGRGSAQRPPPARRGEPLGAQPAGPAARWTQIASLLETQSAAPPDLLRWS